jgi:hypothetical protein
LLPDRRGCDGSGKERCGEDQVQNQKVRFYGPVEHPPEIQLTILFYLRPYHSPIRILDRQGDQPVDGDDSII